MKKLFVVFLHLVFWGLVILGIGGLNSIIYSSFPAWSFGFFKMIIPGLSFNLIIFYAFYSILTPLFLLTKRHLSFFATGISVIIFLTFIYTIVLPFFHFMDWNLTDFNSSISMISVIYTFFVFGIAGTLFRIFFKWFSDVKIKQELERKNLQTELALLKSQINPHFLFNTLNNIDVLITKDSEKASVYLKKLSDILRFMLYETKDEFIPLKHELEYIEKYLELQKIRTSNADFINYSVTGSIEEINVPPMIFIPFIENAFKHTPNKKSKDAIQIHFDIKPDSINFTCSNLKNKKEMTQNSKSGMGIKLIKQRLNLLFKENAVLNIDDTSDSYLVKLKLNLNEN